MMYIKIIFIVMCFITLCEATFAEVTVSNQGSVLPAEANCPVENTNSVFYGCAIGVYQNILSLRKFLG